MRRWGSLVGTAFFAAITLSACGVTLLGEEATDPPNVDGGGDATSSSGGSSASSTSSSSGSTSGASSGSEGGADTGVTDGPIGDKDASTGKDSAVPCVPAACASKTCSSNACDPVVFVTSNTFSGALGGIDGADQKCLQAFTTSLDLNAKAGRVLAWVGVAGMPPGGRFKQSMRPYRLPTGTLVANSWFALVAQDLVHAIDTTETLVALPNAHAWTGLDPNGTPSLNNCTGWTVPGMTLFGDVGRAYVGTRPLWTYDGSDTCGVANHLYCFEQLD